ncbi:MAG TPA: tRNA (adenosine(37)-N6)-threonylcarbamoyltransferase complex transferase subunit TsaD [Candidatus Cybelea sp.]|nr:tRNA (adenosine(37)-N6)-threonylcarbamoyltransferase complex transferase subunit TsaD [Candidatus Cybelea sp.]
MRVLGIETSCDETACAVVDDRRHVLAEVVLSQLDEHRPYQGIVPEIAARAHIAHLDGLVQRVMAKAELEFDDLDGIAATAGPGLIGGVIVGLLTAKGIAAVAGCPLIAVNHLEGHALSVRLIADVPFPYLLLLVSGGHCQLLAVEGVGRYRRLGTTIDDAVGEAFDKIAKLLGLGYPGGPAVERLAATGDARRFKLPRPMLGREGCDFSFSGLKTAVRHAREALHPASPQDYADLAAGFQAAVADVLTDRSMHAMETFRAIHPNARTFVVAGGVAANAHLRARLRQAAERHGFDLVAPPPALCTDNGAMIAWAGLERLRLGMTDALDAPARARWPLDPNAPPAAFAGAKA